MLMDREILNLLFGILILLAFSSFITFILKKNIHSADAQATLQNLEARVRAWWMMFIFFAVAIAIGGIGSIILFALCSFLALREFITLTPTKQGDHRALFWIFFVFTPLQYILVATHWYGLFSVLIPVYGFLFLPARTALVGDCERFLERAAKIQWGLMICVYCLSYAPALLMLKIPGYEGQNAKLLLFLVLVTQMSDVLQYVFGKLIGKTKIAPKVSPQKTWEGFLGGTLSATLLGTLLWWATPFTPWQAALLALNIVLAGFAGGLVMSAIKRDRGVKDYGSSIQGHGGILDRMDSICFAAPIFFHWVRYFFTV